jgi:hypothetical protein
MVRSTFPNIVSPSNPNLNLLPDHLGLSMGRDNENFLYCQQQLTLVNIKRFFHISGVVNSTYGTQGIIGAPLGTSRLSVNTNH